MKKSSVRIRPFNVGGAFEIILPNGKVILLDPAFSCNKFESGNTREDVTGADYIILSHSHFDHDFDLGYFVKKFNSKVFVGAMGALDVVKFHKIPWDNVFPVYPGETYTMDDFTVTFSSAKHNPSGGSVYSPDTDFCKKETGLEGHQACDVRGYMESLDFVITTNNSFRIMAVSGRIIRKEVYDICRRQRPNLLLRQAGFRRGTGGFQAGEQISPKELAEVMTGYGAQVIFPFHQEVMVKRWGLEKTNAYFDEVAKEVDAMDPGALFVNPVAWKWYNISMGVDVE